MENEDQRIEPTPPQVQSTFSETSTTTSDVKRIMNTTCDVSAHSISFTNGTGILIVEQPFEEKNEHQGENLCAQKQSNGCSIGRLNAVSSQAGLMETGE